MSRNDGSFVKKRLLLKRIKSSSLSGFSLLELLVVMALVALLVTWMLPSWQGLQAKFALEQTCSLLKSGCEQARMKALEQHQPVWVIFKHAHSSQGDSFCLLQKLEGNELPIFFKKATLPRGIVFSTAAGTVMAAPPPEEIQQDLPSSFTEHDTILGALHYNSQGALLSSEKKDHPLLLELETTASKSHLKKQLLFSQWSGRGEISEKKP